MKQVKKFEFKYNGDNFIDLNTLLTSQFHFLASVNEIQKELYPEVELRLKVGSFSEGSFIVDLLMESTWVDSLFNKDNAVFLTEIVSAFGSLVTVHKYLKGRKADKIEEKGESVEIKVDGENNSVTIEKAVFNIYKENVTINKSIQQNFELLENDLEIEGVEIIEEGKNSKEKLVDIDRSEFKDLSHTNAYLSRETLDETHLRQNLFIKEPNLLPQKNRVWNWKFIHKGRDIKAKVTDLSLAQKINDGLKIGQGDRLVADLKIQYKYSKTYNTFIESGTYEVVKVHGIMGREQQTAMDF